MAKRRRHKLESTIAALQRRYGPQAVRKGSDLASAPPSALATGFAALDALTGCNGLPLGALTLLSGRTTSGKLTLAYKVLAQAQHGGDPGQVSVAVALVDLGHSSDPDYLARCGVDLARLFVARPHPGAPAVDLLLDLVQSRQVRQVLLDSLPDLLAHPSAYRRLNDTLPRLIQWLRAGGCGLLVVDEPSPPWLRWLGWDRSWAVRQQAALHVELQRARWLMREGELAGYRAQAHVRKSRWARGKRSAPVEIRFNGTVTARETW